MIDHGVQSQMGCYEHSAEVTRLNKLQIYIDLHWYITLKGFKQFSMNEQWCVAKA